MVLPVAKGGPKVIEEIVLTIALPTISRTGPIPSESGFVSAPVQLFPDEKIPSPEGVTSGSENSKDVKPELTQREGLFRDKTSDDSTRFRGTTSEVPPPPQITVIKLEELDLDAPPDFDQIKMNLVNIPQPQTQVIIMEGDSKPNNPEQSKTEDEKKAQPQVALSPNIQLPPGLQHIYTVDPNVIKRLQWRLARMEDFETSIGLAVQEIKEAIAKAETTRLELEEMRKGYATVEKTMHELAALYDLISASVNPFIDSEQEQQSISTKIMKRTLGMTETGAATMAPVPSFTPEPSKKKEEKHVDDYSVDTWTVKWAEFLLERIPKSKISALLDHYIEIGWLDEDVKARIEETIKGINEINLGIHVNEEEGAEGEEERKKLDWWKLPIDDHVKSLQFIEKIRGGKGGGFIPSPPEESKKKK